MKHPFYAATITNPEYRHGMIAAQVEIDIPFQLRALRIKHGLSIAQLAEKSNIRACDIRALENTAKGTKVSIQTLLKLAKAFDVALIVHFAGFEELIKSMEEFNPNKAPKSFSEEFELEENSDNRDPDREFYYEHFQQ